MLGEFSWAPLARLLSAGVSVGGVVIPAERPAGGSSQPPIVQLQPERSLSELPILNPYLSRTIAHLAWEQGIPVFEVGRIGHPQTVATLTGLRPDLGCVACFSQVLPPVPLAVPRLGFLNVHPALLPAYRGPAPLFWIFRNGDQNATGVTVHFLDSGLDTGDIARQAPIHLPDGISGAEAERLCSALGAELLVEAVEELAQGRVRRYQQPAGGSYYPWPTIEDFEISPTWPARRVFNFMCGTAEWGQLYQIEVAGKRLALRSALGYTSEETVSQPYIRLGDEVWIRCTPGVLRAIVTT